ncbi:prepilin-type N-terminal cleavage/methylation domain-containing protein [Candidatus Roizmanbacteria bacterium]|nr:prepilin-type N-terminal cleavage/methylation domain-containing protein [Candidatus Roizmanbacteria bacterium]
MHKSGFSLIEVLVFVSILSIFFVSAMFVTTVSLHNMKVNEHRIIASRYAEDLLEWIRAYKETDWDNFMEKTINGGENPYCFNSTPGSLVDFPGVSSCGYTGIDGLSPVIYRRTATLIQQNSGQIQVAISVNWREGGSVYSVPINATLSIWE